MRATEQTILNIINDGKHMIHRRVIGYDDLQSDKVLITLIMDGYDDKPFYNHINVADVYYANEKLILETLEKHIEQNYLGVTA